uniref:Hemicentin-2-like n=1 Tax=Saccoglossus kowalevskii TaxID=10224 RepID=A0ABM0MB40_SACKO
MKMIERDVHITSNGTCITAVTPDVVSDETPVDSLVIINHNTQLNCSFVDGSAPVKVYWRKGGLVITEDYDLLPGVSGYEVVGEENEFNLRIYDADKEDEDSFSCEDAYNIINAASANLFVIDSQQNCTVYPSSTITTGNNVTLSCIMDLDDTAPGDLVWYRNKAEVMRKTVDPVLKVIVTGNADTSGIVIEGDSFAVICYVLETNPDVDSFLWLSPNKHIISNEESILFESLSRDNSGNYTCQARNTFWDDSEGVGVSTIYIDVQYSPNVKIANQTDVTVIEGDMYIAECLVDSNPVAEIIWIHPDGSTSLGSTLELENISRTDNGTYTCFAETVFWDRSTESDNDYMHINVQYSPNVKIANQTDVTVLEGDMYIAECLVDSNPVAEIIWIHPDGSTSLGSTLELENISRTDSGTTPVLLKLYFGMNLPHQKMILRILMYSVHPATISLFGSSNVYEGSDVVLLCATTDANPRPYEMYINHTDDNGNDNVVAKVEYDLHLLYIITSISEEHSGTYTCYATTRFYDGTIGKSTSCEVVLNVLPYGLTDEYYNSLLRELELLKSITSHKHVVTLIGCCTHDGPIFIVLEYLVFGNLQTYLRERKTNIENTYANLGERVSSLYQHNCVGFSHQISLAMEFIEEKGCVHRDLAARNVLMNDKLVCKLSGFGLATDVLDQREYERRTQ